MKLHTQFSFILLFLLTSILTFGQNRGFALLDKMEDKLLNSEELFMDFTVDIFIPQSREKTIKGSFYKKGEKYYITTDKLVKISDGKDIWSMDKSNNIVYITSAGDESALSPLSIIKSYEKSDYEYSLLNKYPFEGETYRAINIKPKDKSAEYTKMRFLVDKNGNPVQFFIVSRSGERFTFQFSNLAFKLPDTDISFTFEKDEYPDSSVEDLRLD